MSRFQAGRIVRCWTGIVTVGVALTLGNKIHLHNVTSEQFLNDEKWVNHELIHVMQFRKYGYIRFICMYMIESLKKGYYDNKFEIEARREEGEGRREKGGFSCSLQPGTCNLLTAIRFHHERTALPWK